MNSDQKKLKKLDQELMKQDAWHPDDQSYFYTMERIDTETHSAPWREDTVFGDVNYQVLMTAEPLKDPNWSEWLKPGKLVWWANSARFVRFTELSHFVALHNREYCDIRYGKKSDRSVWSYNDQSIGRRRVESPIVGKAIYVDDFDEVSRAKLIYGLEEMRRAMFEKHFWGFYPAAFWSMDSLIVSQIEWWESQKKEGA